MNTGLGGTFLKAALLLTLAAGPSLAAGAEQVGQPSTQMRDALFRQTLKHPTDAAATLAYVKACVAIHDYEAAIGALERLLFYAPNDANIQAQLGLLYHQLQSHQMARQYLDAALAAPGLDEATRAKITGIAADPDGAATGHRFFGLLGGGLRYQSNAAFNPDNNILRLSGEDFAVTRPQERGSDGNAFGLVQIGYDHDLGNQRGDVVELRLAGYATRQFRFADLDVGYYDASIGPRFALMPDVLPGSSVKIYAVGGQTFLAGRRYLASGGGGALADLAVRPNLLIEPAVEVRGVSFSGVSVFSSLNSGEAITGSLTGHAALGPHLEATARVFVQRDRADLAFQTSTSVAEEFALVAHFAAPLPAIRTPWSLSPYVKLLQTRFDAANPFIDAATVRRDSEVQYGAVLDTPITTTVDVVTSVGNAHVSSNIPNYRLHDFSVLSGPTVRF